MNQENYENSIAIIGISGRFPKARNTNEFWQNLLEETDCITRFTDEELIAEGEDLELLSNSNYVKAKGIIEEPECFDANFFGISPAEAATIDPQQRLFLELCWHAIEDANINVGLEKRSIGVFGAGGMSTYLLHSLSKNPRLLKENDTYQLMLGNDKDYLSTRVSYKLNLSGPSITVQTACSSSLVAIHMASQSLLNGECDMALAGGVSVSFPHKRGYIYQQGMILSPDGICRPFDKDAQGTVEGTGAGVVLLKRLEDAINDKDEIYAVIRGSAINNDGSDKIGYTAPSINKQAEVISEAMEIAEVNPSEITYIETHGTGTPLGDPIEIAALTKAFRAKTNKVGYCAIGSLKSNIGHLNSAAGVAGLIKVALALKNKYIPASLNFSSPNPKIDFKQSPFYVNGSTQEWKGNNGELKVAGVSSFGIGGTNAHVILSEAPTFENNETQLSLRKNHVLTISAKSKEAVERYSLDLKKFLQSNRNIDLADVAYTSQIGRQENEYRRSIVCSVIDDAVNKLSEVSKFPVYLSENSTQMVWMFSGQGSQHLGMARQIYNNEPVYRQEFDKCCEILKPHLMGRNLRDLIFVEEITDNKVLAEIELQNTSLAQPALFVLEYSLSKLLISWGIKPAAMLGHSIGEYVAATLAGVMSLHDAIELVAYRGRLMQSLPKGLMLSVGLSEDELLKFIAKQPDLDIAAVNSPNSCVVSGEVRAVETFKTILDNAGIASRTLHTSHAFHSNMMNPIINEFTEFMDRIKLNPPKIPYMSNVTGEWITQEQACSNEYWAKHLRETVRFSDMVKVLEENGFTHFVEIGPGQVLSSLARQTLKTASSISILPAVKDNQDDAAFLMGAVGQLWSMGIHVEWSSIYKGENRVKIKLPLYPFQRQSHSLEFQNLDININYGNEISIPIKKPIKQYKNRQNIKSQYVPPENELEMLIVELWEELFQVNPIGRNDDFFELGGNSLMAIQLLGRIKSIFLVDISVNELFQIPTIENLSRQILDKLESLTEEQAEDVQNKIASMLVEVNKNEH